MRRIALSVAASLVVACALVAFALSAATVPASATTATPSFTPTATPTPNPPGTFTLTNPLANAAANAVRIDVQRANWSAPVPVVVSAAPGCGTAVVAFHTSIILGYLPFPIGPVYQTTTELHWPATCIDPGESIVVTYAPDLNPFGVALVGVVFFDTSIATPTPTFTAIPTATSTPTAIPTPFVALDCDTSAPGIQSECTITLDQSSIDVDVVFFSASDVALSVLGFTVTDSDLSRLAAPAIPDPIPSYDSNPDFNQAILGTASFNCGSPPPDNDNGSGAHLSCFMSGPAGIPVMAALPLTLATVHYDIPPGASPGSVTLGFASLALDDALFSEIGSCNPTIELLLQCFDATVRLVVPPPTVTPTATPTPPLGITKVPEGNAANIDPSIPAANLWLCVAPAACAGMGEGELRVVEHATNVRSDYDADGVADYVDPDIDGAGLSNTELGLGAYEFTVEYDNFVIQSVNPCDIVFGPGGDGVLRGPVDEANTSSPKNADCAPDPGIGAPGTCAYSLVLENLIRFGCVTGGPDPQALGPSGNMDLAWLVLVPHPDLTNDIFPGNSNGVVTVLKDNGCELADILGHPMLYSVNGGLTPVCGDLAVTVRILEGDINLDCTVDVTDEQMISFRYGAFFGDLFYQKWFDLEPATHDLDIDIKDLQKVFGRDSSTCQAPIPDQPPQPPPAPFG